MNYELREIFRLGIYDNNELSSSKNWRVLVIEGVSV